MDTGKKRAPPTHPGKPQRPTKVRIVGQAESLIGNRFSGGFGSSGALSMLQDRNEMMQMLREEMRSVGQVNETKEEEAARRQQVLKLWTHYDPY